jgi:hypothetical protein
MARTGLSSKKNAEAYKRLEVRGSSGSEQESTVWRGCDNFRGGETPPMARLGRYFLPDQALHVIQRGNNRQPIFHEPDDYGPICDGWAKRLRRMAVPFTPMS